MCHGLGGNNSATYCAEHVFSSPSGIDGIVRFGEKIHYVTHLSFPCFVYVYTVAVVLLKCGAGVSPWIAMG